MNGSSLLSSELFVINSYRLILHASNLFACFLKFVVYYTSSGASTPYIRWSKRSMEKVGGSVFAET